MKRLIAFLLITASAFAATYAERPDILLHGENDPRPLYQVASQESRSTFPVVLDVAGSGVIRSIWGGTGKLSIYVDGEKTPSISLSWNQFFFQPSTSSPPIHTDEHGYGEGGYRNIGIPFHTHIKVVTTGEWCNVSYNYSRTLDFHYGRYDKLHVAVGSWDNATGPFTILKSAGRGAVYGLFLHLVGPRIMFEGDTVWSVDGLKAPNANETGRYSGTEELFGLGYYFVAQMKSAYDWNLSSANMVKTNYSGIAAAYSQGKDVNFSGYRYFNHAPITWNKSITFQWGTDPQWGGSKVTHADFVLFYYTGKS